MELRRYMPRETIFREGEYGSSFYEVRSGSVGIYAAWDGETRELTRLGPGAVFGEMAAIMSSPRSATAVAIEETEVAEVEREALADFFFHRPERLMDLMQAMTRRTRELTADLKEVNDTLEALRASKRSEGLFAKLRRHKNGGAAKHSDTWQTSGEAIRMWREETGAALREADAYEKGGVIFRAGERGDCMYDIERGSVGIYLDYGGQGQKLLRTLHAGEIFGEMGLIDCEVRSADAVAMENGTRLLLIRDVDLPLLFHQRKDTVERLLKQLSDRLHNLTDQYMKACQELDELS